MRTESRGPASSIVSPDYPLYHSHSNDRCGNLWKLSVNRRDSPCTADSFRRICYPHTYGIFTDLNCIRDKDLLLFRCFFVYRGGMVHTANSSAAALKSGYPLLHSWKNIPNHKVNELIDIHLRVVIPFYDC